jgi:hypothetical protein
MRRISLWAPALSPAVVAALLALGCGGSSTTGGGGGGGGDHKTETGKKSAGGGALTELATTGWGTLKGRVTLAGSPPANLDEETKKLQEAMKAKDNAHCLADVPADHAADKEQQTWRIGQNGGVQNVFVWLNPPAGKFFKVDTQDKTWKDEVVLDQPHCAFEPHAFVLFPSYIDPKTKKSAETGQKFIIRNNAKMPHNTNWKGDAANPGDNKIIPGKEEGKPPSTLAVELSPSPKEVDIKCDIHTWMRAYARVFNHPYAAVTDKDGNYEIKHVPTGAEVHIVTWHEAAGFGDAGQNGKAVTLKEGENTENFKVTAAK